MSWWDDKFMMQIIRPYWLLVRESVNRWLFTITNGQWFIWYHHELTFEQTFDMTVIKLIGAWKFERNIKYIIVKSILVIDGWSISYKIAFMKSLSD